MNILQHYYNLSVFYLKKYLPTIPEFKYSKIEGDNGGKIEPINIGMYKITININHMNYPSLDIIETICHEFAHMFYWEHDKNHEELTQAFTNFVLANERLENKKLHELEIKQWEYIKLESEEIIKEHINFKWIV